MTLKDKLYKIGEDNSTLVTCMFYNPIKKEIKEIIVDDLDNVYQRGMTDPNYTSEQLEFLKNMPICEEALKAYNSHQGTIQIGDIIEVYKGRKVPKGTISKVIKIVPFYDNYKRWVCDYVYLEDGQRTNINNCKLA